MSDLNDFNPGPNKYDCLLNPLHMGGWRCSTCGSAVSDQARHFEWHQSQDLDAKQLGEDKEDPHKFDEFQREVLDLLENIVENTRYRSTGGPL